MTVCYSWQFFRHYAISSKYLYMMQTSQKLEITTPAKENQADF
jgi:hypothetical protein